LRTALALWRGPVLADFAYEPFAQPAIARLEELRLAALERRIDADLRLGRNGTLVGELEELVAAHPLREQLRGQLMLALYRAGRQAEAVGLYHEGRRLLVDELGIEPSSELRELASRVLRQDTSLAADGSAEAGPEREIRNPYKGLHAFIEADAEDFFGREQLVGELVARVADERFLAVVGPSGSGKSSVVLAGLVPEIRARGWKIAVMTPGAYALEELEAALLRIAVNPPSSLREQLEADELGLLRAVKRVLPDDGSDLLLVVDQLEEVFTLVEDDERRMHFLSSLELAVRDPRSRLRVVATLRADFYDRPLLHRGFGEVMRNAVETVLPLSPDELERATASPARRVGVTLEEGLLAQVVADVVEEPGALPLLQYALTELHERRDGSTSHAGGVQGDRRNLRGDRRPSGGPLRGTGRRRPRGCAPALPAPGHARRGRGYPSAGRADRARLARRRSGPARARDRRVRGRAAALLRPRPPDRGADGRGSPPPPSRTSRSIPS
jgi:energy-coupling factor transporter ATP-binding protein EcfA2